MKLKQSICLLGVLAALSSVPALADTVGEGNWMVRVRAAHLNMANKSDALSGVPNSNDLITVNDKWIPEVDISYFFTEHFATELVLTYPQKQNAYLDGQNIGSFRHLPPTLMLQYHILPKNDIRPYVGVGLNATHISDVNLPVGMSLDSWSVGPALQVGVDFKLAPSWYLNVDMKKVWINTDVKVDGGKISNAQLNPLIIGVGVGYRF